MSAPPRDSGLETLLELWDSLTDEDQTVLKVAARAAGEAVRDHFLGEVKQAKERRRARRRVAPPPPPPAPDDTVKRRQQLIADVRLLRLDPRTLLTRASVRTAYRARALELHPDRGGNDRGMAELNAAYRRVLAFVGSTPVTS